MSRCFPFPPPGYEKKAKTKDVDLLKKEKHKEKKQKKEKRDKEKRETKDKKETEKSEGKHTEKKDKKEKNRDKKKDKEKDRDKNKNSVPDDKRLLGQAECQIGEKLIHREEKDKGKNNSLDEKRNAGQFAGYSAKKQSESSHLVVGTQDFKFVQEFGKRIKDDNRATENKLAEKFTNTDQRKDEGTVKLVAKGTDIRVEGKEKSKRVDDRKMDGPGIKGESRFSGNSTVPNPAAGVARTRVEGISGLFDKNIDRRADEKEKAKEKEIDNKRGDKHKEKDREKKSQGKGKDRDKEKKKEKAKVKTEHKNTEHDKLKESKQSDLINSHNARTPKLPKDSDKSATSEEGLKKRKEVDTNGVLHASDVRPNKLARPSSSSQQFPVNGRVLELCQTSVTNASDRPGAASNLKVENKERKINGVIDQSSSVSSKKPMLASAQAEQIVEVFAKPPHPDAKYLSEVYAVPKMSKWSDYDDQEWLFSSNDFQSEKPKVESSRNEDTLQVWEEALRIESADICALPYVIPY